MHQDWEGVHDLVVWLHPEVSGLDLLVILPLDKADQAFNLFTIEGVLLWILVGEKIQGLTAVDFLVESRSPKVYSFVLLGKELTQYDWVVELLFGQLRAYCGVHRVFEAWTHFTAVGSEGVSVIVDEVWIGINLVQAIIDRAEVSFLRLIAEAGFSELRWEYMFLQIYLDSSRLRITGFQNFDVN